MGNHVILVGADRFGEGSDELGRILVGSFFNSLAAAEENPSAVLFINSGVKLTTTGSELLDIIREIESQGALILSCGTCLDYYGFRDSLEVGQVGNMMDTVDRLQRASSVIRI